MEFKSQNKIDPNKLVETRLYIRNNTIESHEDWINFGQHVKHVFNDIEKIDEKTMDISFYN